MAALFKRGEGAAARKPLSRAVMQRRTPILKSPRETQIMREAGRIVARVHEAMRAAVRPGVSTLELDTIAAGVMQRFGAASSFLGYHGYPANICTSINDELVHGIPSASRLLHEGDIVSIDVGVTHRGFIGDSAWTYAVGAIPEVAQHLMRITEESLYKAIEAAQAGKRVVDISRAVHRHVESNGLHIVKAYTGHGVGRSMHEAPQVLNYDGGDPEGETQLDPGLVIAVEPMVQVGTWLTRTLDDKWTVVSRDGSLAAHFEHTIAITHNGPEVLTAP